MTMDFVAIDLETANADMASICRIGIAGFRGGEVVGEWKSYVDPEDYFDPINVSIHGITAQTVIGQPTLPAVLDEVMSRLDQQVVVSHTHFDRVAVKQALGRYKLSTPRCSWLDSARVARRTWRECSSSGYGLRKVCQLIGYEFAHHDALEDAKAAGQILLAAIGATGLSVSDWLSRVQQPIVPHSATAGPLDREGCADGPLSGEIMVFTGALQLPRREAAALAASIGCEVASGVTKRTTLLVVGDQDVRKLAGHDRSSKHRKAEALISAGQQLRILRETDFLMMVNMATTPNES